MSEIIGTCLLCNTNAVVLKGKDGVCGDCIETRIILPATPKETKGDL